MSKKTEIAVPQAPLDLVTSQKTFDDFLAYLKGVIGAFKVDLSTKTGRAEVASVAHQIIRSKTAIKDAIATEKKKFREIINSYDERYIEIEKVLDTMSVEFRKPLTDWEVAEQAKAEAEKKRIDHCNTVMARLREAQIIALGTTSDQVLERLRKISDFEIEAGTFLEMHHTAVELQAETIQILRDGASMLVKQEAAVAAEKERSDAKKAAEAAKAEPEILPPEPKAEPAKPSGIIDAEPGTYRTVDNANSVSSAGAVDRKVILSIVTNALVANCGVDAGMARKIVLSIASKQIPHLKLEF